MKKLMLCGAILCTISILLSGCGTELRPEAGSTTGGANTQEVILDKNGNPISVEKDDSSSQTANPEETQTEQVEYDYSFSIEGEKEYHLPIPVSELMNDGWIPENENEVVAAGAYTARTIFTKNGKSLITQVENPTEEQKSIADCQIGSVMMETEYDAKISFNGFSYGESIEKMKEVFGDPTNEADGEVFYLVGMNKYMQAKFTNNVCTSIFFTWM